MKKIFNLDEIDCASCAQKFEHELSLIEGVLSAQVSFINQTLTIEADDANFTSVIERVKQRAAQVEPDCEIIG